MGAISGAMIMAPMMAGALFDRSPKVAMAVARINMKKKPREGTAGLPHEGVDLLGREGALGRRGPLPHSLLQRPSVPETKTRRTSSLYLAEASFCQMTHRVRLRQVTQCQRLLARPSGSMGENDAIRPSLS